jgi:hypothetical protein
MHSTGLICHNCPTILRLSFATKASVSNLSLPAIGWISDEAQQRGGIHQGSSMSTVKHGHMLPIPVMKWSSLTWCCCTEREIQRLWVPIRGTIETLDQLVWAWQCAQMFRLILYAIKSRTPSRTKLKDRNREGLWTMISRAERTRGSDV